MSFALRHFLIALICMITLLSVSACSKFVSMFGGPFVIEISREELTTKLGQKFPLKKQVLERFEFTATTPRLTMQPDINRVLANIDISAQDGLFMKNYQGTLWLSFGLRYEPGDQTVRLQQVTVDKVSLQGLPDRLERHLTKISAWLAQDRLHNFVVHRLTPQQLDKAEQFGLSISEINISPNGLAIVLLPKS